MSIVMCFTMDPKSLDDLRTLPNMGSTPACRQIARPGHALRSGIAQRRLDYPARGVVFLEPLGRDAFVGIQAK